MITSNLGFKIGAIFQMKGEKELVEQVLQTEIKLFNAIRDGSALMQHMEDFYYVTLLEVCYWCTLLGINVTPKLLKIQSLT